MTIKDICDKELVANCEFMADVKAKIVLIDLGMLFHYKCRLDSYGHQCRSLAKFRSNGLSCRDCGALRSDQVKVVYLFPVVIEDYTGKMPIFLLDEAETLLDTPASIARDLVNTWSGYCILRQLIFGIMEKDILFKLRLINQDFHFSDKKHLDICTYCIVHDIKDRNPVDEP